MNYTKEETALIQKFLNKNPTMDYHTAGCCVFSFTRRLRRDKPDSVLLLLDIFGLSGEEWIKKIGATLDYLIEINLLDKTLTAAGELLDVSKEYFSVCSQRFNLPDIKKEITVIEKNLDRDNIIELLGQVSDKGNFESQLTQLQTASDEILFPILNMDCYGELARILIECAERGVAVKILAASEKIAKKIRGQSAKATYQEWQQKCKGVKNIHIKVYDDIAAANMATSFMVDGRVLRYVVYDPQKQRSRDGYLLQVSNDDNTLKINLINHFQDLFDKAWAKARFINPVKRIFTSPVFYKLLGAVFFALMYFVVKDIEVLTNIYWSLFGVFGFTLLRDFWHCISGFLKNLTSNKRKKG